MCGPITPVATHKIDLLHGVRLRSAWLLLCVLAVSGCASSPIAPVADDPDAPPVADAMTEAAEPLEQRERVQTARGTSESGFFRRAIQLAAFSRADAQDKDDAGTTARELTAGRQAFEQAEELFRDKQYKAAEAAFRKLAKKHKDTPLEEDALFMIAECEFLTSRYPRAQDSYNRLLKKYANSRHLDEATRRLFSIARIWLSDVFPNEAFTAPSGALANLVSPSTPMIDRHGRALEALSSVRLHDPTGPLADDSLMMTASYYFLRGKYEDADTYFQALRQNYPQSKHQPLAHLLGVRAKIRAYQGPDYDGRQLEQAERLLRSTLRQFPELEDERADLLRTLESVRQQKAEKIWNTADYYRRSGHPQSAQVYYRQLLDRYGDTKWGVLAQERLDSGGRAGDPNSPSAEEEE